MKKYTLLAASSLLLLSACEGAANNPGYVCMHDCAHYCEDGIKGDQCRRNIELQQSQRGLQPTDNGEYYYPDGDHAYYYGVHPGHVVYKPIPPYVPAAPTDTYTRVIESPDGSTTTTTTVTSPY